MKNIIPFLLILFLYTTSFSQNDVLHQQMAKVVVREVLQVNNYTYLRVIENENEKWLALPTIQANVGETYYYSDGMAMGEFESKELKRTFKEITFLATIYPDPTKQVTQEPNLGKTETEKINLNIEKAEGEITIAELFENKSKYAGKLVTIKGKVKKFSTQIMGKNWIHLQDGTEYNGEYDLTITSSANTKINDIITIEGKVVLDKDFGHGYFYKIIIEDGILK